MDKIPMAPNNRITSDSIVDLILNLKWKSSAAVHTDGYQASRVNIWRDPLPQVVLDALMNKETGEFKDLQTYSIRGVPRPHDDKYFPELLFSDPVFAVWGRKK